MRKILLALAAVATVGIAVPSATSQASAETIVVKRGGHHHGGWHRGHRSHKVVIVKRGRGHMHRGHRY